jgi:D-arabinose 1-dehydrogenase-like Zn-dependent alcohol dehydrogenase
MRLVGRCGRRRTIARVQAVVYDRPAATPVVREIAPPQCPADGVVVRVRATGVCRSDWHAWKGHDPVPLPMVPGHEFSGTVDEVGSGVTSWKVGDRVTVPFVLGCGRCEYCAAGEQQVCPDQSQPGFTIPGSWAELVAVPAAETNMVRLPGAVDFVVGATLGCRFATAFRAVRTHGQVEAGQVVAVHGCGGAGLSAVMIAKALGARVIAVDLSEEARRLAGVLGADDVVDPVATPDVAARIRELTGGGAHVSLDAVGHPAVAASSVTCLRRRGRHVQVGLLLGADATAGLPMDLVVSRELQVLGSHGMPAGDYPAMLEMIARGDLDPRRLVHSLIDLAAAPAALMAMDDPSGILGMTVISAGMPRDAAATSG